MNDLAGDRETRRQIHAEIDRALNQWSREDVAKGSLQIHFGTGFRSLDVEVTIGRWARGDR